MASLAAEFVFPAATNWYAAHTLDALPCGTMALATNQFVTLLDGSTRRVLGTTGGKTRVTGVALQDGHVFTTCADKSVHAYDVATLSRVGSHKDHHAEPTAIIVTPKHCITGDKRGTLCFWPLDTLATPRGLERLLTQKDPVVCFALPAASQQSNSGGTVSGDAEAGLLQTAAEEAPAAAAAPAATPGPARNLLAAGFTNGYVAVVSLETKTVVCGFSLSAMVQGLAWLVNGGRGDHLVTACQDQSVQVWHPDTVTGQADLRERIADAPERSDGSENRAWVSVCTTPGGSILYSGPRGELTCVAAGRRKPARSAPVHNRPIFSIRPVGAEHYATVGMDRLIVLWTLGKGASPQMVWRLCGMGGHVTSMGTDGSNWLFVGGGDQRIRVVDLMHREHRQHCWMIWNGIRATVTSVSAAPGQHHQLASAGPAMWAVGFGDGSLGVVAVSATEGPGPVEPLCDANRGHQRAVTALCWLRLPGEGGKPDDPVGPEVQAAGAEAPGEVGSAAAETAAAPTGTAGPEGPERGKGRGKRGREEKKKGEGGVASFKDCKAHLSGIVLVSAGAGGSKRSVLVTRPGAATPRPTALDLQPVGSTPAVLTAAAAWPLPQDIGDALVVAGNHPASADGVEVNSLQIFHPGKAGQDGLKCEFAAAADDLNGEVTAMDVRCAHHPTEVAAHGQDPEVRGWVACGGIRGDLSIFNIRWPPAPVLLPPEATCRAAHGKSVTAVQWRQQGDLSASIGSMLLSASQDGCVKVWLCGGRPMKLECIHSLASPSLRSLGGSLSSACWDLSDVGGKGDGDENTNDALHTVPAILAGGRDQIVFRWVPGQEPDPQTQVPVAAKTKAAQPVTGGPAGGQKKATSKATGPKEVAAHASPGPSSAAAPKPHAADLHDSQRGPKPRAQKAASSLLALASAKLHQQSMKGRAHDLLDLVPDVGAKPWPAGTWMDQQRQPYGDSTEVAPPSLTAAIFTNRQDYADWWADQELRHKVASITAGSDHSSLVASAMPQRARLLRLWAAGVEEAMALEWGDVTGAGDRFSDDGFSAAWAWAALSAGAATPGQGAWETALRQLVDEALWPPGGGGAAAVSGESMHFAAAAALALGADDEAVRIYMKADLFADALLLARLRFPAKHPLIPHIYEQWAVDLRRRGRPEQAAACCLAIGRQGAALKELDDWLSPRLPMQLGPDLMRLAGTCAAARVAASIAAHHLASAPLPCAMVCPRPDDEDAVEYDASLAFDHRQWQGRLELRKAVQAWKRCLAEALRAGHHQEAVEFARVAEDCETVSAIEQFLSAAMAGYASAAAWWSELMSSSWPSDYADVASGTAGASPLRLFLERGQNNVAPEEDWDFEWRALTWLPFFDRREDPLLSAAVELGRACAALASGSTRMASVADAPLSHITAAAEVLLAAEVNAGDLDVPLSRLGSLALQPGAPLALRARGRCVAAAIQLPASGPAPVGVDVAGGQWDTASLVLFGLDLPPAGADAAGVAAAALLRRGHRLLAEQGRASCDGSPLALPLHAAVAAAASAAARPGAPSLRAAALLEEMEGAVLGFADGCGIGLPAPQSEAGTGERAEPAPAPAPAEDAVARLMRLHDACDSPLLVAFAVTAWCAQLLGRQGAVDQVEDEYEMAESARDAVGSHAGGTMSPWAETLHGIAQFLRDTEVRASKDGSCSAEECEALRGVWQLQSSERLSWSARLARLRLYLKDDSEGSSPPAVLCELLGALPITSGGP